MEIDIYDEKIFDMQHARYVKIYMAIFLILVVDYKPGISPKDEI